MEGSIIGSFRKYYTEIVQIIELFQETGISILSPRESQVIDPKEEFVLLCVDDRSLVPVEIQLIAFHRILRSDFVYVWDPQGYVGLTTCYEIGRITERGIPLFFSEFPKDLPIFMPQNAIWKPEDLASFVAANGNLPKLFGTLSTGFARQLHNGIFVGRYYE